MRVISQDGTVDMPYENVMFTLYCDRNKTKYYINGNVIYLEDGSFVRIAEYSTREKAEKAMEMLRETYVGMPIVMQNIDVSEDIVKEFERLKKCGVMVRTENQPSKVEYINNAIFRFPQDDEIEV